MNLRASAITLAIMMMISFSSFAGNGPPPGGGTPPGNRPPPPVDTPLTDDTIAGLVWVREEEKLARDTYITMYDLWGARIFNNISRSEQNHMDAMLVLLTKHGIADPVISDELGVFSDEILDDLFDELVEDGTPSLLDALKVGAYIEELDIHDIRNALAEATQADIIAVYENLLAGSYNHLRAFVGQIDILGGTFEPVVLEQFEVDDILSQDGKKAHKGRQPKGGK